MEKLAKKVEKIFASTENHEISLPLFTEKKKAEERRRKREARATYLQEVLTVRSQQIDDRQKQRAEENREIERERERVNKFVHEHIAHQQARLEYQKNKSRQYARDLIAQQSYTNSLRSGGASCAREA